MSELPFNIEQDLERGRELYQLERNFKEAKESFTETLTSLNNYYDGDPESLKKHQALVYNERGLCKYMQVCFDDAVEDYTQAIQLDPTLAAAYYNRGTICYRLCATKCHEMDERQDLHRRATEDFQEAVRLAPDNTEFQLGLKECNAIATPGAGDEEDRVWDLDNISKKKLVKLLFLLDNSDDTTGTIKHGKLNTEAVKGGIWCFLFFLKYKNLVHNQILQNVLRNRVRQILNCFPLSLPRGSEAESLGFQKDEEDLLILAEAYRHLGLKSQHLDEKKNDIQHRMNFTESEKNGTFCLYAENLLMTHLCDDLTPTLVFDLFNIMIEDKSLCDKIDGDLDISLDQLKEIEGLKEGLFFYMIRMLEYHKMQNRLYTYKLQHFLHILNKQRSPEEQEIITKYLLKLEHYPGECQPTGLCIVFCVTDDREGADLEITKITSVFHDILGFTIKVEKNPSAKTIDEYKKELRKSKYRFYDSIVYWFLSHGTEKDLLLPNNKEYRREDFVDSFSKLDNFSKKPKIFFMASCQGNEHIPVEETGNYEATIDGEGKTYVDYPDAAHDTSYVYYQMDRLIAYATLRSKYAFRLKDHGSVYVDCVCSSLKEHCGKNITQVLEEVCQKIHRIVFYSEEKKTSEEKEKEFEGNAKQACFYESTFQKTFIIPKGL
ncbi:uncharacterized protein LOC121855632 isoform X2 [Homarus americanus]|uniref:uncharacterized protein LOC121855632 isoform X2 n=1 Tax=Homarus americanus TaxID=6706 RepID=UPI001C439A1F|nr:uncharacterized protein LOC121855632 isoform X2 [Homarus americanus]